MLSCEGGRRRVTSLESAGARSAGEVLLLPGPRRAEARLLSDLAALAEAARADPACLARPVRVVVPSNSLREHLAARLVARLGRPVAGVAIQTLFGVSCGILERSGEVPSTPRLALPVWVRRFAQREPADPVPVRRGRPGHRFGLRRAALPPGRQPLRGRRPV